MRNAITIRVQIDRGELGSKHTYESGQGGGTNKEESQQDPFVGCTYKTPHIEKSFLLVEAGAITNLSDNVFKTLYKNFHAGRQMLLHDIAVPGQNEI